MPRSTRSRSCRSRRIRCSGTHLESVASRRWEPDFSAARSRHIVPGRVSVPATAVNTMSSIPNVPLIVDLDGTLLRSDLLHESVLELARVTPHLIFLLPFWLASGKAALKQQLARRVRLDIAALPFDLRVLDWIETQRAAGRKVVLCT